MTHSIGIIQGSTRPSSNGMPITSWIQQLISNDKSLRCTYVGIDLAAWNLPLLNEPHVPAKQGPIHEHTKAWSRHIQSLDAFVLVTPQYNWGYPAALKNALDYLFHEWNGKPAVIVSYGGRGGGKAAAQLEQVLQGLRMKHIASVSTICLTEDHLLHGLTVEQAEETFADSAPGILRAVKLLEQSLSLE